MPLSTHLLGIPLPICAAIHLWIPSIHLSVYSSNICLYTCPSIYTSIVEVVAMATPKELGVKNGYTLRSFGSCRSGQTFHDSLTKNKTFKTKFFFCVFLGCSFPSYKGTSSGTNHKRINWEVTE